MADPWHDVPIFVFACSRAGKLERREAEAVYRCIAALPCGEDIGSCARLEQTFEDGACAVDWLEALDAAGRWYEPGVLDAALECTHESCSDVFACLDAWFAALYDEP